ncbi:hypothetical protein [Acanthopleuribacter pedis]|uniref:Uncharacterized protein n=1 Tax=Acanthopleuribacter pedis TaxID=442870 RepID=A0A8J7Q523_9BACT|nr:hypothetical protein [Acanthopleuribacter pedis]MBO1318252.1 hypothetical protein [Acanthopleuribacter pedis]
MKHLLFICSLMLACLAAAQDQPVQLVYPWVSHNAQFTSTLFITNHAERPASLVMIATRGDGTPFTAQHEIPARGFLKRPITELFPSLDEGSGLAVQVRAESDQITGRWLTFNRQTGSSGSPAQGVAIKPLSRNHPAVGQMMTLDTVGSDAEFTSALVFLNLGEQETRVTLTFADENGDFLETFAPIEVALKPYIPVAQPVTELIGGDLGDLSVHAVSEGQPFTTVHFMFNSAAEPAMASGSTIYPDVRDVQPTPTSFTFSFDKGDHGFVHGFADYPADNTEVFEFKGGLENLPTPYSGQGYLISARNASDDLFMYLKRRIDGLVPGARYDVAIEADFLSNAGTGCAGIGGAPGESVTVKFGAVNREPVALRGPDAFVTMGIDKGNQTQDGSEMKAVGDVATDADCSGSVFGEKSLTLASHQVEADAWGRIWVIVGTDSGFEGTTDLYYRAIEVSLNPLR